MDLPLLAAALTWPRTEPAALAQIATVETEQTAGDGADGRDSQREPSTAGIRSWTRAQRLVVPARGRLCPAIREAWNAADQP